MDRNTERNWLSTNLDALSQYSQRQHLGFGCGFFDSFAVNENAWQFGNLRQPATVFFTITLDGQIHADTERTGMGNG